MSHELGAVKRREFRLELSESRRIVPEWTSTRTHPGTSQSDTPRCERGPGSPAPDKSCTTIAGSVASRTSSIARTAFHAARFQPARSAIASKARQFIREQGEVLIVDVIEVVGLFLRPLAPLHS
jgi:hypothetical protein